MRRARHDPHATAFRFLKNGDPAKQQVLTYGKLADGAKKIAGGLQSIGAVKTPIPVVMNPSLDFVAAFFGIILAGGVPVPLRTPGKGQSSGYLPFLRSVLETLETTTVYCDQTNATQLQEAAQAGVDCLSPGQLPDCDSTHWQRVERGPGDPALVQFTSGSTGAPKGVCISHGNLIANAEAIVAAGIYGPGEKHLSWMPHYHDMGLIGGIVAPVAVGVEAILMSPQAFMRSPMAWLRAISHFRVHSSGGPNFAYDMVTRAAIQDDANRLDLSCWRTAYCGAEPINEASLQRFASHMESRGFSTQALFPCYGMAETTLFVTGRHRVESRRETDQSGRSFVSVGRASDDTRISILNPGSMEKLPEGGVGEVCVAGPAVSAGYYPHGIQRAVENMATGQHALVRTGDLGFLAAGELHICGRIKDLVIIRGQNFYPQDIEHYAMDVARGHGIGVAVAFGVEQEATEGLVLVLGIRKRAAQVINFASVASEVRAALMQNLQIAPMQIVLIPSGEIPKTSSGKLQRSECRRKLLRAELTQIDSWSISPHEQTASLYPNLNCVIAKYESRNLRYRFDLEADIDWHRTAERGRYFSDTFLRQTRVNLELLKSHPDAFAFFEWALALQTAQQFADLERAVLEWGDIVRDVSEPTRSLDLLEEEEVKHIELFQRYSDHLQAMRPDVAQRVLGSLRLSRGDTLRDMFDASAYHSLRHQHYNAWLSILFFEEFTLWIDHSLSELGDQVQPTWKQAHGCHRREESQHVITDEAYIYGLDTTQLERDAWSRLCLRRVFSAMRIEYDSLISLTAEMFPQLSAKLASDDSDWHIDSSHFLRHRLLRRTCSVVPDAARIMEHLYGASGEASDCGVEIEPSVLRAAIRGIVADIAHVPASAIVDTDSFSNLGLDSLCFVQLAMEVERLVDRSVEVDTLYSNPTVEALAAALRAGDEQHAFGGSAKAWIEPNGAREMFTLLNRAGSAKPLIWIGGSSLLPLLKQQLPVDQPVIYLHHMGSDGALPDFRTVEDLASAYRELIDDSMVLNGFHLGGYSIGGLIAFELARQFDESGNAPESLFLISPATPRNIMGATKGDPCRSGESRLQNRSLKKQLGSFYRRRKDIGKRQLETVYRTLRRQPTVYRCRRSFRKGMAPASDDLWAFLVPRYVRARDRYAIRCGFSGSITLVYEGRFPLKSWLPVLQESRLTRCLVDCSHLDFHSKEFAAVWFPYLHDALSYNTLDTAAGAFRGSAVQGQA